MYVCLTRKQTERGGNQPNERNRERERELTAQHSLVSAVVVIVNFACKVDDDAEVHVSAETHTHTTTNRLVVIVGRPLTDQVIGNSSQLGGA